MYGRQFYQPQPMMAAVVNLLGSIIPTQDNFRALQHNGVGCISVNKESWARQAVNERGKSKGGNSLLLNKDKGPSL